MALIITDDCINCDVCQPEMSQRGHCSGEEIYFIDANLCTECIGHFDQPQCQQVCPVDCIPVDPAHIESKEELLTKYRLLTGNP